jgi:hypothetical protein
MRCNRDPFVPHALLEVTMTGNGWGYFFLLRFRFWTFDWLWVRR